VVRIDASLISIIAEIMIWGRDELYKSYNGSSSVLRIIIMTPTRLKKHHVRGTIPFFRLHGLGWRNTDI